MSTEKNRLVESSMQTEQSPVKETIKSGQRVEQKKTLPIYEVVSSHDRNDDIMIIHLAYPVTSSQNLYNNYNAMQCDKSSLPVDKPIRPIGKANGENISHDKESQKA
jgi:hypothetical protein